MSSGRSAGFTIGRGSKGSLLADDVEGAGQLLGNHAPGRAVILDHRGEAKAPSSLESILAHGEGGMLRLLPQTAHLADDTDGLLDASQPRRLRNASLQPDRQPVDRAGRPAGETTAQVLWYVRRLQVPN